MSERLALGLALSAPRSNDGWRRVHALAEHADGLGFHSLWLPENHFHPGATASPLAILAGLAARTRRIRLATTSLLLPIQHPLRVAADVATLDHLSGGRVLLGLGRGFRAPLFRAFGVDVTTKRDRFDESLDAMLRAWSGEPFRLEGDHWNARGNAPVRLELRPLQAPHPPLVVAAFGPKGLAQAARRGLPYLASPLEPLSILEENYARWRDGLGAEPDPRAPRVPVMRTVHVATDDVAADHVREALEREARAMSNAGGKTPASIARAAAAPIAERVVVGTRAEVEDQLAALRERLGMDLLVARTEVPATDEAARDASLERLAELLGTAAAA